MAEIDDYSYKLLEMSKKNG